jgi:hypothetical protein
MKAAQRPKPEIHAALIAVQLSDPAEPDEMTAHQ